MTVVARFSSAASRANAVQVRQGQNVASSAMQSGTRRSLAVPLMLSFQ